MYFLNPMSGSGLDTGNSEGRRHTPRSQESVTCRSGVGSGKVSGRPASAQGELGPSPARQACSQHHPMSKACVAPGMARASCAQCHIPEPISDGRCSCKGQFRGDSENLGWQPPAWMHHKPETFLSKCHPAVRGLETPRATPSLGEGASG